MAFNQILFSIFVYLGAAFAGQWWVEYWVFSSVLGMLTS